MIFIPIWDGANGCASFIVGDDSDGRAIVVDPLAVFGADRYILDAAEVGLKIVGVIETHVHADHHSAARELAQKTDLLVSMGYQAPLQDAFNPLHEGDLFDLGGVKVKILETPGHTPESISLVVTDAARSPEPWFVLSGDSLFVGDVGRPDLVDPTPELTERAALAQFHSIHDKILSLSDTTELYPAHYGASACGGLFLSPKPISTVGYERRWNRFAQITEPQEFVSELLSLLKPPPLGAAGIRRQNLGEHASH